MSDQPEISATNLPGPKHFNPVKLLDLISRIVPSAFFLLVVTLNFVNLYTLVTRAGPLRNSPAFWRFLAALLAKSSTTCFLALMSVLFLVRIEPIKKANGILPRVMALAGTFCLYVVTLFPRTSLSVMQTMVAVMISLLGTCLAIVALAHLGRSFSLMAEARRLVTTGPYSMVRHPLYLFEAIASLGILLQFLSFSTLLIFLAYGLIQLQRMKNEEAVLGLAFPEYQAYRSRTARLIPKLY